MLAAENGHKDVVLFLTQKGANLDLVNKVSVHAHLLYEKVNITFSYNMTFYTFVFL